MDIIETALIDKSLTPQDFRALCYIVRNIDNVYLTKLKDDLQIKTNRTMSIIIKRLIKNGYISRIKKNDINKKGFSPYQYLICSNKTQIQEKTTNKEKIKPSRHKKFENCEIEQKPQFSNPVNYFTSGQTLNNSILFNDADEIVKYFYEVIKPNKFNKDISRVFAVRLMEKDGFTKQNIKSCIDEVSKIEKKYPISSLSGIRNYLKKKN